AWPEPLAGASEAAIGGDDVALAGDARALQLEPGRRITGLEQMPALARHHRVGDEREAVEQPPEQHLPHQRNARHDGDFAAVAGLQVAYEGLEVTGDEGGIVPAQPALEGARGDVFRHRVDEAGKALVLLRGGPVAGPFLIAD